MSDDAVNLPIFYGEYRYGVDDSRRVMFPARWRPSDPKVVFTGVLWPVKAEEFILVLPPERWQMLLDSLKSKSLTDQRFAALERTIGATSAPLTLDKVGRFCLPDHLAIPAAIQKEALLVSRLGKFEMWNPGRYEATRAADKTVASELIKEISL